MTFLSRRAHRRARSSTLCALAALALSAALAPAAPAATPIHGARDVLPYKFSVDCGPFGLNFSNDVSGVETRTVDIFTGADGTPIRQVTHDAFRETDTNSVTDKTLPFGGSQVETLDFVAGTRTVVGQVFLMTEPGRGVVIHDTGRAVFDAPFHTIFEAGPKDVLHGDVDQLACQALAP